MNSQLDAPLFLPYLRGLQESPAAAGSLTGLRDIHSRESLCYSVLEGLCFEYKRRLQSAERCTGTSFSRVRAVGRLSHENVFLQLKADILGKPIDVLAQPEAVSQGAAVLAGKFCGLIRKWKPDITVSFLPSSEKKYFKIRFEQYLQEVSRIL